MKCSNCSKIITSCRDCIFCGEKCCCFICLESHYLTAHKNKNNESKSKEKNITKQIFKKESKSHSKQKDKKENEKEQISPYLVTGILHKRIKYNHKYNLENFTPELEKNEIRTIGSGSFGQVYLARNNIDHKLYAIKHMDKNKLIKILHSLKGIYQEIDIQSRIDHPNIVKILYTDEDEESFDLVMEYAENGNLFHYIRKNKGLSELKTFQLFIQVVNAINFLHENDLIHRDIKPENILLFTNFEKNNGNNTDYIVKLCDFGWCVKLDGQKRDTFCGTTEYMSPELVNHKVYSKEIDVWSLGILLYEMIHGYSPFRPNKPKFNEKEVFENIKKHNLRFGKRVSEQCKNLIYNLLAFNKNKRYKVEDIYISKFVKSFEKVNYLLPQQNNENINIINDDENINQIHQIKTNNNNNFIYSENNKDVKHDNSEDKKNNDMSKKKQINEVYKELKQLNKQELRKVLTKNSIDHKMIKSFSKRKKIHEKKNKDTLSLNGNKSDNDANHSISFIKKNKNNFNRTLNKNRKRKVNKSANDLCNIFKEKFRTLKNDYHSIKREFKYYCKTPGLDILDDALKKNRTHSKKREVFHNKEYKLIFNNNLKIVNNDTKSNTNNYINNDKDNNNLMKIKYKKNRINSFIVINKENLNKNKLTQININKINNFNNKKPIHKKSYTQCNQKERKVFNNIHPIETNAGSKILLNKKSNDITNLTNYNLKDYAPYKNISQRLKTNTNITNNNSTTNKIKNENNKKNISKEKNIKLNLTKKNIRKNEKNKIGKKNIINNNLELNTPKENSKEGVAKNSSICNIKKMHSSKQAILRYKDSNSIFNDIDNMNNNDTIKIEFCSEYINQLRVKNPFDFMRIKSKTNFSPSKSPNIQNFYQNPKFSHSITKTQKNSPNNERKIKEKQKNILKINNLSNRTKKLTKNKNTSLNSPINHRRINEIVLSNVNSFNNNKNKSKKISKSRSPKMNMSRIGKRQLNSVNNKTRTKMSKNINYSNNISNEKILHNNSNLSSMNFSYKKNINGVNKNLFSEKERDLFRIQSDRIMLKDKNNFNNNKKSKSNFFKNQNGNLVIIKPQKFDKNNNITNDKIIKNIKNISPENLQNLLRNNTTKNKKRISPTQKLKKDNYTQQQKVTNLKLQNKKSFCYISRNKPMQNKCHHIICGPINKIDNINYQSNNINNFYIINNTNINNNEANLHQKFLKKKYTDSQKRDIKKNIDYSKFILPISFVENRSANYTFNKSNNSKINKKNASKSLSKKKEKLSLKHYLVNMKNKIFHSYNNKHIKKREKSNSKDSDTNIIYGDSDFSDEDERNITPKKNKDNVKINPIKLLGDFKKEYNVYHKFK